eukprot:5983256-Prymnesium_polylepis.1
MGHEDEWLELIDGFAVLRKGGEPQRCGEGARCTTAQAATPGRVVREARRRRSAKHKWASFPSSCADCPSEARPPWTCTW